VPGDELTYKAEWNRWQLPVIDRDFPSCRLCNNCGAINDRLTLADQEWGRDSGTHHQQNFLAARNLRDEGLRILAVGLLASN
jgi:putative transposase